MLVDITKEGDGFWGNEGWLTLNSASLGSRIYKNDIVYFVGHLDGMYSLTNTIGGTTTVEGRVRQSGGEVSAQAALLGSGERGEHLFLHGTHLRAGVLEASTPGWGELARRCSAARRGHRTGNEPPVLQAAQHAVHGLTRHERAPSEVRVGQS